MTPPPAQDGTSPVRVTGLLQVLFIVHGVVTFAAAVVLVVLPAAIPASVNIDIDADAFLLSYFLAAAEAALALLSFGAAFLSDRAALRLIVVVFIVFHLATALLEIAYLAISPIGPVLLANILVRILAAALFVIAWRTHDRRASAGMPPSRGKAVR